MPNKSDCNADSMLEDFLDTINTELSNEKFHTNHKPMTLWIPKVYKMKFDLIQGRTNRKFGKILKEVIKKSIDKVDLEAI
jgi:CRISPR/Cas system CSM-associated protein Csm2 small subunit